MKATLEYLSKKHRELISTNYDGQKCWNIAIETASKLQEEGIVPHIETAYEVMEKFKTRRLYPKPLKGVDWGVHHVCCTTDEAFDPLIGYPVQKRDYCTILFGKELTMYVRESEFETARQIERYKWEAASGIK